ncbi:MAG: hypothetical protein L6R48_21430, partial [Planctomycetes bacterium]|nr:hypothetical protein [Planctomycetota bacterium]
TEAWYALGEALRLAGRPHEAVGAFHRADELARAAGGSPHLLALAHAGLALVESVDFRSAGAEFARLRTIAPDDPLVELGAIHLPGARFPEAMRAAVASTARAAAAAPHLWELQLAAGQAASLALEDGILDPADLRPAATRALRQAYALAPSQPAVVIALAGCLRNNGTPAERAEADALFAAAASANPSSPYLIGSDLLLAVSRRDLARAKGMLAHFRALDPPPAMAGMIDCFLALAEDSGGEAYQRAADRLNAISHWPDFRHPAIVAGLDIPGRREHALALWRAWREEPLDHPIKRFVAAQVARLSGDREAEDREVAAGLAMAPWNARLLDLALVRATTSGRVPDLDLLRRFTAAAPSHRAGWAALVVELHRAGLNDEARASLGLMRRHHPREDDLLRRLAALVEAGR